MKKQGREGRHAEGWMLLRDPFNHLFQCPSDRGAHMGAGGNFRSTEMECFLEDMVVLFKTHF